MGKQDTRRARTAFGALCATTFAAFLYKTVLDTGGVPYTLSLGGSTAEAGMQASAFFAASIIARFVTGPLSDSYGDHKAMLAGLALLAAAAFALALADELWQVVCARCVQACGLAAFYPAAAVTVGAIAPEKRRGSWLGIFRLAVALPMLFGPSLFLSLAGEAGWGTCFALLGALLLAAFSLEVAVGGRAAAGQPRTSAAARERSSGIGRAIIRAFVDNPRTLPTVLTVAFAAAVPFSLASAFSVVFASHAGAQAGVFFALFGVAGIVGSPLAGKASDRIGPKRLMAASVTLEACGAAALALSVAIGSPLAMYAAAALVGLGKSGCAVGILAFSSQEIGESSRTFAIALQQSAGDLGSAIAVALVGGTFAAAGPTAWPIAAAGIVAALSVIAIWRA